MRSRKDALRTQLTETPTRYDVATSPVCIEGIDVFIAANGQCRCDAAALTSPLRRIQDTPYGCRYVAASEEEP